MTVFIRHIDHQPAKSGGVRYAIDYTETAPPSGDSQQTCYTFDPGRAKVCDEAMRAGQPVALVLARADAFGTRLLCVTRAA